ncbi:MAG TPA: hypothetical protein PKI03_16540, partial [Pseudomonadota bacterium]|nr:hypothetical protein [Pseudomonadota bacterium]
AESGQAGRPQEVALAPPLVQTPAGSRSEEATPPPHRGLAPAPDGSGLRPAPLVPAAAPPQVHIRIGRIELRGPAPAHPRPPTTQNAQPAAPSLSLSDYLRRPLGSQEGGG